MRGPGALPLDPTGAPGPDSLSYYFHIRIIFLRIGVWSPRPQRVQGSALAFSFRAASNARVVATSFQADTNPPQPAGWLGLVHETSTNLACRHAHPDHGCGATHPGPYVDLGGGVDVLQNENVKPSGFGPSPRHYSLDPGGVPEAAVGYGFGNGLRVEAKADYAYTRVHGVELPAPFPAERAGGHQQQYGGLANVLYDLDLHLPARPYLGIGAGYRQLELDQINSSSYGAPTGRGPSEARGNFAYQGITGIAVATPVRGLSVTLDYRLIGMLSPGAYFRGDATVEELVLNAATPAVPAGQYINVRSQPPVFRQVQLSAHATFNNIFNHEILIGLRYAFGAAPPLPPARQPVPPAVPAPAAARTYLVFFDWDSAALTARAHAIIAGAAQDAARVRVTTLEVDGHADSSHALPGERGRRYNLRLSLRRADAVRAALIGDGVAAAAITVHGFGDGHPLVPTGPNTREPQNRRVEIVLR